MIKKLLILSMILYIVPIFIIGSVYGHHCKPSITSVSGTHAPFKICSGRLIFEDNFDKLDLRKWQHEQTLGGGGNWEFQWYTNNRSNSYVEDGKLHIRPTLVSDDYGIDFLYSGTLDVNGGELGDHCTNPRDYGCIRTGSRTNILNPIKSARLRSLYSFAFTYGKLEVRAKLPVGDWLWPAIWLLPKWSDYSSWPASGEIDVMESRGNRQYTDESGTNVGVEQISTGLHFGPNSGHNGNDYAHFLKNLKTGYNTAFHNYQLEWTPDYIKFFIDDELIGKVVPSEEGFWKVGHFQHSGLDNPWKRNSKMAPFDQEFYIILNLAVGGTQFFPDNIKNMPGGKPWSNSGSNALTTFWEGREQWLPTWNLKSQDTHLQIDYVRVWAL